MYVCTCALSLSSNFHIHVSVSDLDFSRDRSTYFLQQNRQIDRGNICFQFFGFGSLQCILMVLQAFETEKTFAMKRFYLEERTFLYKLEGSGVNLECTEVNTLLHLL